MKTFASLEPRMNPLQTIFAPVGKVGLKGIVAPLLNNHWEGWLEVEEAP